MPSDKPFVRVVLPEDLDQAIREALRDGETIAAFIRSAAQRELRRRGDKREFAPIVWGRVPGQSAAGE